MKHFRLFTFIYCLLSSLAAYIITFMISYNVCNTYDNPLVFILPFLSYISIHDYFCRDVVCAVRKKHNITDGCYFWNCPHYSVCPYNSNK